MNVSLLLCFLYVFFSSFACSRSCCRCTFCFILVFCWPLCLWHHYIYNFFVVLNGHRQRFFFLCSFSFSVSCSHFWFCYTFVFLRSPALCATAIGSPEMLQHNVLHSAFCISVWTVCEDVPPCHHNREKFALKCTFEFLFDVRAKRKQQIIKQKKKTPTITTTIDKDDK